ncbi:hypothetical protein Pla22_43510 [Rubripirellula amarantea]|uniref:Collagen-binding domain of a collagenase n=1 Tax=Rubripirellula amarantea TaxID=2527999 RepID=A0A5C5WGB7_9BACT|nr:DUF5060 domain-containing protein [Rubripirellula amarantea]TWT49159.1 hypothetical protein Pla22_43510 [Rubripirellula amarantea]
MKTRTIPLMWIGRCFALSVFWLSVATTSFAATDGNGEAEISGELKQWHKVTLSIDGPFAREKDSMPNPFTDLAMNVTFRHESGMPEYNVPGYFAADGNAANTSADEGTTWRAHLSPDKSGKWTYKVSFKKGDAAAIKGGGEALKPFDGIAGSFEVTETDKSGRDFRSKGRLQYVGKHHLQFAGTKEYFLKAGPDAPETLLGYTDFDNTHAGKAKQVPLKTWKAHVQDWKAGDPTWKDGNGKGLIGGLNYLADKGLNAFSFLSYNAGGDGDNVWPFVERNDKLHYDCSKLDQWGMVFDHGNSLGLYLHFKLQETEIDDHRNGPERKSVQVPTSLDGGKLGPERMLYCRELIARYGHALALNWNVGEENTQTPDEVNAMIDYIRSIDPYQHHVVLHTYPQDQEKVYTKLLGDKSRLSGVSCQNSWRESHKWTLRWVTESDRAGRPWVVANDEQGGADTGVPPDLGYDGYEGTKNDGKSVHTTDDVRKATLWGNLMAGGAGVEYYFGYQLPQNDLVCEDWRSRDQSWDYCRIALQFFSDNQIPFWEMKNADASIGNSAHNNSKYCFAKDGEVYLVYLPQGGSTSLDLSEVKGSFQVHWFNPRSGGDLVTSSVKSVDGGQSVSLGDPPSDKDQDWLIVVRK